MRKPVHNSKKASPVASRPDRKNITLRDMPPYSENRPRVAEPTRAASARRPSTGGGRNSRSDVAKPILPPRKQPNRRQKDRRPLLWSIAGLVVLGALVAWALIDPRLDVKHVSVRGAQTVSPSDIARFAPIPSHRNILLYYLTRHRSIAERVERSEPVLQSAQVAIQLPHTIVVTVTERQPYALLSEGDGGFWVLDSHGVPFRELPSRPPDLPCVILPSSSLNPELGQPVSLENATPIGAFYQTIALLSSPRMAILSKIREITVDQNANLCLNMSNNLQIRLGQPDNLAQKLALAATALSEDSGLLDKAQYLDFTDPQRPAWKPRSSIVPVAPLPRDNAD
jgi:cell division protein FtsQ